MAMAKRKKARVPGKSGPTVINEETKTTAIEDWLRMLDKPLGIKEGDGRRRQKGRGAKR
jgi:hypothetical protein